MEQVARRRSLGEGAVLLILLLILMALILYFYSPNTQPELESGDAGNLGGAFFGTVPFTITGDVTNAISPGAMIPIDLELTNPHDLPMTVSAIAVTVQTITAPRADKRHPCTEADFAVEQASDALVTTVGAGVTRTLSSTDIGSKAWPHIGMLNLPVNQDGCKGASLVLAYSGSGTLQD